MSQLNACDSELVRHVPAANKFAMSVTPLTSRAPHSMQSLLQTVWISHLVGGLLSVTWADRTVHASRVTSHARVGICLVAIEGV